MKVDEVITVDLSEEDMDDEDVVSLGNKNAIFDPDAQESSNNNDNEDYFEGQSIPLKGL